MRRGIVVLVILCLLFLSCHPSNKNTKDYDRDHFLFLNGVGEWERAHNHDHWEVSPREMKRQTFTIGDNTRVFIPGSPEAEKWIAKRRAELRARAIERGVNPDFYIDKNIEEGERSY